MKVKELIEKLKSHSPNMDVMISSEESWESLTDIESIIPAHINEEGDIFEAKYVPEFEPNTLVILGLI